MKEEWNWSKIDAKNIKLMNTSFSPLAHSYWKGRKFLLHASSAGRAQPLLPLLLLQLSLLGQKCSHHTPAWSWPLKSQFTAFCHLYSSFSRSSENCIFTQILSSPHHTWDQPVLVFRLFPHPGDTLQIFSSPALTPGLNTGMGNPAVFRTQEQGDYGNQDFSIVHSMYSCPKDILPLGDCIRRNRKRCWRLYPNDGLSMSLCSDTPLHSKDGYSYQAWD